MPSARDILKRIRRIELRTRKLVNTAIAGQYHSVFKGRGMNFDEVREYSPGDEVRTIDWNVTARMGEPFVKKYTEERELTVMIMVDLSASGNFGSKVASKRELAAEVGAVLAFSAIHNNDKVGLVLFTDKVELYIPPKKGRAHALRVIREILFFEPAGTATDLSAALEYLNHVLNRRSVVFLLSDFESPDFRRQLGLTARRHDLVAVPITDPFEHELPNLGLLVLEDAETGEQIEVNTRSLATRKAFAGLNARRRGHLESLFKQHRIDSIPLHTDEDYLPALRSFFERRERRLMNR
jgi:uncharacterized protein (DUF58 family)